MMWAMWDPSKYMRQIDLAVVNEDAGVEKQGIGLEGHAERRPVLMLGGRRHAMLA